MSIGWILHRDWIAVDQAFADELQGVLAFHRPAPGSTLVLVGRAVRHAPEFVLRVVGHPVVLIAESYDGNDGAIDTSGTIGAVGGDASALSLYALSATNVRLIARGGTSTRGRGGAGGLITFRSLAPSGIQARPELSGKGGAGATPGASIAPTLSWYTRSAQWRADIDAVLGSRVAHAA
ncbi:MAG TPA: hypothetical protein VGK18_16205 [Propionicimonas sp.]|jgi:hypothetical protein|uniref:hypothetical protein n=1 Tax=Propionicimonas sp. TaxID=1955623 RepID=UPI002F40F4D0